MTSPVLRWSGVFPAALTMFDRQGRLDAVAMREHVERLVLAGAHGIVAAGTSGEFISLERDERLELISLVVDAVADRIPVIAGTGTAGTTSTIALTRDAAAVGATGAIVILPYYQRPTHHEVMRHLEAVGEASPIPVMVYNNPSNSGAPALAAADLASLYRRGLASGVATRH